jgi:hypothetical protein
MFITLTKLWGEVDMKISIVYMAMVHAPWEIAILFDRKSDIFMSSTH